MNSNIPFAGSNDVEPHKSCECHSSHPFCALRLSHKKHPLSLGLKDCIKSEDPFMEVFDEDHLKH